MSFHLLNEEEAEGPEGVILAQGPCANLTMKSNNPPPVRRVAADHTVDAHTRAIRLRSIRVAEGDNSHDDFAIRWLTLSSVHQL